MEMSLALIKCHFCACTCTFFWCIATKRQTELLAKAPNSLHCLGERLGHRRTIACIAHLKSLAGAEMLKLKPHLVDSEIDHWPYYKGTESTQAATIPACKAVTPSKKSSFRTSSRKTAVSGSQLSKSSWHERLLMTPYFPVHRCQTTVSPQLNPLWASCHSQTGVCFSASSCRPRQRLVHTRKLVPHCSVMQLLPPPVPAPCPWSGRDGAPSADPRCKGNSKSGRPENCGCCLVV